MLTVIIPVYNVEAYLNECVESVVGQLYKDMEIILVDDGSTDDSGKLCDMWASRDTRIRVIHKSNGGLSSARNVGLEYARGEYITFVDSDDIIDKAMHAYLLEVFEKEKDVDIVCCGIECFNDLNYSQKNILLNLYNQTFTTSEYFKLLLEHKIDNAVCNKIYKKNIIKETRFRLGRINEDILFNVEVMEYVNKLYYSANTFYKYRIRNGSITQQANPKLFDFIDNAFEIKEIILNRVGERLSREVEGYIYYEMVNYIATIRKYHSCVNINVEKYVVCCKQYILKDFTSFFNPYWSWKQKIKFFMVLYFPTLYRTLLNIHKRVVVLI